MRGIMAKKPAPSESVYKLVEVIGTSTKSWEDAANKAVETAAKTLRDLQIGCGTLWQRTLHLAKAFTNWSRSSAPVPSLGKTRRTRPWRLPQKPSVICRSDAGHYGKEPCT